MELFSMDKAKKGGIEEGQLSMARVVKILPGKGATVQLDSKTFAFLDICEISDELLPNVLQSLQKVGVFKVRIIQT
jgi:hypothetical protein